MALNSLFCADVPLRNCSLTHLSITSRPTRFLHRPASTAVPATPLVAGRISRTMGSCPCTTGHVLVRRCSRDRNNSGQQVSTVTCSPVDTTGWRAASKPAPRSRRPVLLVDPYEII